MELFGIGGLALAGHLLSKNNIKTKPPVKKNASATKNFDNVYSSNNVHRVREEIQKKANLRTDLAKHPRETGVIPSSYNSDSEFSENMSQGEDGESIGSNINNPSDPNFFMRSCENITNNIKYEQKQDNHKNTDKNNYLSQFEQLSYNNPGAPSSINSVAHVTGDKANATKLETERNLALNGGYSDFHNKNDMTYGVTTKEKFTHNNMKPWFSAKTGMGYDPNQAIKLAEVMQRKVEKFTGSSDNIEFRPKTERRPLFTPSVGAGVTNIYGAPVMTDYYEQRYIPGYEKKNEKPFQEMKITPGVNLGYNENGTHGLHDTFRVLPKTVDELRSASNPKTTFSPPVINEQKEQKGPIAQKVFKRRPMTYREEKIEDMLPQMTEFKAPTVYGHFDPGNMSTINRGSCETEHMGPAKLYIDLPIPESMKEEVRTAVKQQYKHADPRNVQKLEGKDATEHIENYDAKMTLRGQNLNYIGPAGLEKNERTYAFDHDNAVPDATNRNMYETTKRAGQIGNSEMSGHYVFDGENMVPVMTNRNMTEKTDRVGQMGNAEFTKHNVFDATNIVPDVTKRNIHEKTERAGTGVGNSEINKTYVYDGVNWVPGATKRNMHEKTDRAGQVGNSAFNKHIVFDGINWIPEPTKRNIHEKTNRAGQVGNSEFSKHIVIDGINWIPDPTKRNIHEKTERVGQMGNTEFGKHYVFDGVNMVPDLTRRNIHEKTDRMGQIGNSDSSKHYVFDGVNFIPDLTRRNIHEKTDRIGIIGNSEQSKNYVYDGVNWVPNTTMRNVHEKINRAGQIGNAEFSKTYVFDGVNWVPNSTMRNIHEKTDRAGQIGNSQLDKSYVFDGVNWVPAPTKRNIHDKKDRAGNGLAWHENQRGRGDAGNMRENTAKEIIAQGRAPTTANYDKGPIIDYTVVELRVPIQNNRELYPENQDINSERLIIADTRMPTTLPQQSWRFYSFVEENLHGNPYINNIIHQSPL